jgi:hypothetical protein
LKVAALLDKQNCIAPVICIPGRLQPL